MTMEQWLPIPGYEGRYVVSDHGRVKSVERSFVRADGSPLPLRERELKQIVSNAGYLRVYLTGDGRSKRWVSVHRCVAAAFIGVPVAGMQVNHIDGNKLNNRASNLEWVTSSANNRHKYATGLAKSKNIRALCDANRKAVVVDGKHRFESITEAAEFIGSTESAVCQVARGRYRSTKGHTVEYAEVM